MNKNCGLTVVELLVGVIISMTVISSTYSIASSFFSRIEISGAVSSITSYLSNARYLSLSESRKVRFRISDKEIQIQIRKDNRWINFRKTRIKGKINITSTASPVFSPTGSASPLCSIRVSNNRYSRIITLSFAGRIKIRKVKY